MKLQHIVLAFSLLILCSTRICAQENQSFDLQLFIESFFNLQDESINYEDLYERLLLLYESPINLNSASVNELKSIHLLSNAQIDSLKSYIDQNGKLLTLYELQLIEGFDINTIERILPFITVDSSELTRDDRPLHQRILTERNNYLIYRYSQPLETKEGFAPRESPDDNKYAGGRASHYLRYRVSKPGDFSLGLTTEIDAGEKFTWDSETHRYGMDFWSVHFMVENHKGFRKIILGDYQLQFGQGLIFGTGLGIGKGSETINTLERVNLGIRPYTSVLEGGFLRGTAFTLELGEPLELTTFVSRTRQDAFIRNDSESYESYFSSFQTSGYHRTANEIENKNQVTETVLGANLHIKINEITQFGVVLSTTHYSLPVQRSDQAYNLFEFTGNHNQNASFYTNFKIRQFRFFGELGISKSGGRGQVFGFTSKLIPQLEFAMLFRKYTRDFHSLRGNSFAEGSRNINENGIYWGFKYTLNSKLFLTAYYDTFYFPWLRFRADTPSEGNDYMLRLNYLPRSGLQVYVQYRNKAKEGNGSPGIDALQMVQRGVKEQALINLDYDIHERLTLRSRIQMSRFEISGLSSNGYAFIQDAIYHASPFVFSGRIALFDTEGLNNRQYTYERDALYAFSIPAYSGEGIRNYLLIQYKLNSQLDFWLRLARTTYYDRDEIGTGLETIQGNKKTDLRFQLRFKIR